MGRLMEQLCLKDGRFYYTFWLWPPHATARASPLPVRGKGQANRCPNPLVTQLVTIVSRSREPARGLAGRTFGLDVASMGTYRHAF
ncbi:hypothetical protein HYH02_014169 [Chlamydomonas schloesseri]|uniref:Uncharacterized protein n=1 Tax=Chlamydomonas schloesseri TaxID=2026947 RepID=A0A835VTX2_9CHLO|nr:hypothetical protein HYH02_014169 [Chlamydomonas schloesseri]|eukprot:KAG2429132.1 hypothetical protein HYH02_014169 [Chlamydomonas schloesseri]